MSRHSKYAGGVWPLDPKLTQKFDLKWPLNITWQFEYKILLLVCIIDVSAWKRQPGNQLPARPKESVWYLHSFRITTVRAHEYRDPNPRTIYGLAALSFTPPAGSARRRPMLG